jgi:hypothetical protein
MTSPDLDPAEARVNWLRHIAAPGVFREVLSAFEARGIPVLPVKGVVTAHRLYEDVAARPLGDIDLRIPRRCFQEVIAVAKARAWTANTDGPVLWNALLKVDGTEVDVECTLGPPGLCALSVDDVIVRARRVVEPFGFPHLEPEMNDHAIVLVINAFKDGLWPMPWALEDLRRIARHPEFDAEIMVGRARAGRVASALWIVADWLGHDHDLVEWREVRDRVGPRPPSPRVARAYGYVRRRGWPSRAGFLATAASNDDLRGCVSGLVLAAAGIVRGRAVRVSHGRS